MLVITKRAVTTIGKIKQKILERKSISRACISCGVISVIKKKIIRYNVFAITHIYRYT